jgi:hypothetical protein
MPPIVLARHALEAVPSLLLSHILGEYNRIVVYDIPLITYDSVDVRACVRYVTSRYR